MIFFFLFSCFFILSLPPSLARSLACIVFWFSFERAFFFRMKRFLEAGALCVWVDVISLSLVFAVYLKIVLVFWVPNINSVIHTHAIWVMCGYIEQKNWWKIISWEREREKDATIWTSSERESLNRICAGFCVFELGEWGKAHFYHIWVAHRLENIESKRNILNFQRESNRVEFNQCLCIFITFYWNLLRFLIKIAFFFQI